MIDDIIPIAHLARVAHLVLGLLLIFAPYWKLGFARVLFAYWILFNCLEIYSPFWHGKGFNMLVSILFIVYFIVWSTNHWLVDTFTAVTGFIFCTWLWPLYAVGDLEPAGGVS